MKKILLAVIGLMFVCAAVGIWSHTNVAADEAANTPVLLVLELQCTGVSDGLCKSASDAVFQEMANSGKYTVVDPKKRDEAIQALGPKAATCMADKDCRKNIAKDLGAQKMLIGTLAKVQKLHNLALSLMDVETGNEEGSASERCPMCNDDKVVAIASKAAKKLLGE